ncbi:MAG: HdeD family acid-resistance protein, partial [Nitrososphaeraceae archaeon]
KGKWATIGLGILVLIFAGFAISFPEWTAFVITILVGFALLFNGCARIVEGISGKHSGWAKFFLIGVGILSIIIGTVVLASPLFGVVFVGLIIAIGLLITGIQMIAVGAAGRSIIPDSPTTT